MAERAAAAVAGDDRLGDLDGLRRIDGHGPFLIASGHAPPAFDPGGGAMIPIARRRSTGRRHRLRGRAPSLEGTPLHPSYAGCETAP